MTLEEVEAEVDGRIALWGKGPGYRFLRTRSDDGWPHVEGTHPRFQFITTERGLETCRTEMDAEGLIFVAVNETARSIATTEEFRTRRGDYSRGTWMEGHIRLMAMQSEDWGRRVSQAYATTLKKNPLRADEQAHERRLDLTAFGCQS